MVADAVGELVDDVRELLLGQVGRTGLDVDHPEPRLHLDDLGAGVVATTGEDVGLATPAWASADTSSRT